MNKIMMLKGGSPAEHKLGNIGRDEDDYIRVWEENEEFFIGAFEEGYGFTDVNFYKSDVRPLTEDEIAFINRMWLTINGNVLFKYEVDMNGNVVESK